MFSQFLLLLIGVFLIDSFPEANNTEKSDVNNNKPANNPNSNNGQKIDNGQNVNNNNSGTENKNEEALNKNNSDPKANAENLNKDNNAQSNNNDNSSNTNNNNKINDNVNKNDDTANKDKNNLNNDSNNKDSTDKNNNYKDNENDNKANTNNNNLTNDNNNQDSANNNNASDINNKNGTDENNHENPEDKSKNPIDPKNELGSNSDPNSNQTENKNPNPNNIIDSNTQNNPNDEKKMNFNNDPYSDILIHPTNTTGSISYSKFTKKFNIDETNTPNRVTKVKPHQYHINFGDDLMCFNKQEMSLVPCESQNSNGSIWKINKIQSENVKNNNSEKGEELFQFMNNKEAGFYDWRTEYCLASVFSNEKYRLEIKECDEKDPMQQFFIEFANTNKNNLTFDEEPNELSPVEKKEDAYQKNKTPLQSDLEKLNPLDLENMKKDDLLKLTNSNNKLNGDNCENGNANANLDNNNNGTNLPTSIQANSNDPNRNNINSNITNIKDSINPAANQNNIAQPISPIKDAPNTSYNPLEAPIQALPNNDNQIQPTSGVNDDTYYNGATSPASISNQNNENNQPINENNSNDMSNTGIDPFATITNNHDSQNPSLSNNIAGVPAINDNLQNQDLNNINIDNSALNNSNNPKDADSDAIAVLDNHIKAPVDLFINDSLKKEAGLPEAQSLPITSENQNTIIENNMQGAEIGNSPEINTDVDSKTSRDNTNDAGLDNKDNLNNDNKANFNSEDDKFSSEKAIKDLDDLQNKKFKGLLSTKPKLNEEKSDNDMSISKNSEQKEADNANKNAPSSFSFIKKPQTQPDDKEILMATLLHRNNTSNPQFYDENKYLVDNYFKGDVGLAREYDSARNSMILNDMIKEKDNPPNKNDLANKAIEGKNPADNNKLGNNNNSIDDKNVDNPKKDLIGKSFGYAKPAQLKNHPKKESKKNYPEKIQENITEDYFDLSSDPSSKKFNPLKAAAIKIMLGVDAYLHEKMNGIQRKGPITNLKNSKKYDPYDEILKKIKSKEYIDDDTNSLNSDNSNADTNENNLASDEIKNKEMEERDKRDKEAFLKLLEDTYNNVKSYLR